MFFEKISRLYLQGAIALPSSNLMYLTKPKLTMVNARPINRLSLLFLFCWGSTLNIQKALYAEHVIFITIKNRYELHLLLIINTL